MVMKRVVGRDAKACVYGADDVRIVLKTTARMDPRYRRVETAVLYERKNVTFHLASISFHKV